MPLADNSGWTRTSPLGSDFRRLGDDNIRSFRSYTETNVDAEHYFNTESASSKSGGLHRAGSSRISYGNFADLQTSDYAGRQYYAVDKNTLYFTDDSGTTAIQGGFFGAKAFLNTETALSNNSSVHVEFDSEAFDVGGYFSPPSRSLTIPAGLGGVYAIHGAVRWTENFAGNVQLHLNNNPIPGFVGGSEFSADIKQIQAFAITAASEGSQIQMNLAQTSGSIRTLDDFGVEGSTFLAVYRLGPLP